MDTPEHFRFAISDGSIHKIETATGEVCARWLPIGTVVVEVVELGGKLIVREDYYQFPPEASNLYCLDFDLNLVWSAERTSSTDAYANPIFIEDGDIVCASWEGETATIDPDSGRVIKGIFTK